MTESREECQQENVISWSTNQSHRIFATLTLTFPDNHKPHIYFCKKNVWQWHFSSPRGWFQRQMLHNFLTLSGSKRMELKVLRCFKLWIFKWGSGSWTRAAGQTPSQSALVLFMGLHGQLLSGFPAPTEHWLTHILCLCAWECVSPEEYPCVNIRLYLHVCQDPCLKSEK